jgi:hypothetical protein
LRLGQRGGLHGMRTLIEFGQAIATIALLSVHLNQEVQQGVALKGRGMHRVDS